MPEYSTKLEICKGYDVYFIFTDKTIGYVAQNKKDSSEISVIAEESPEGWEFIREIDNEKKPIYKIHCTKNSVIKKEEIRERIKEHCRLNLIDVIDSIEKTSNLGELCQENLQEDFQNLR